MSLPSVNFLHLTESKKWPGQEFKLMVTVTRLKVKSRSHHDVAHLHPVSNVLTKCQLPTPYSFSEILPGQDFIRQGQYSKVKGQIKVTP